MLFRVAIAHACARRSVDGIRHADPTDDQGGEADQRQELCEPLDALGEARIGIGPAADLPARLRGALTHPRFHRIEGGARGQLDPVAPPAEAARLDETSTTKASAIRSGVARNRCRPQSCRARTGSFRAGSAVTGKRDPVAGLEIEAGQQGGVGQRAGARRPSRRAGRQGHRADP